MKTPLILIVDDDLSILKFVRANLEARNYAVLTAENGEEAVKIAGKEKPDLILLDIMMSGMDGFTACRNIREFNKAPIIMLSAREGEADREKSTACGANEYLTKPFVLKELLAHIKLQLKPE
jgi:DNA-binding response OmpR family regulator